MTKELQSRPLPLEGRQQGEIPPDLVPLSELSRGGHIRIINQLSNLILWTVRSLDAQRVPGLAREISGSASAILAEYDADIADVIARAASRPEGA